MERIPEYPPILTNNAQQDLYNLREYIIRNLDRVSVSSGVSGCQASIYFESFSEQVQEYLEEIKGQAGVRLQGDAVVTPTTEEQIITPSEGYDALVQVTVEAAPTETLSVTPAAAAQTFTPSTEKVGFSQVSVGAVSAELEEETVTPQATAFAVTPSAGKLGLSKVNVNAAPLETPATVMPTTSDRTITPTGDNIGLSQVVVAGDVDLVAGNIKKDVVIFGVTGTYEGGAVVGSLIEIACSSNIDEVTATVNGNTYSAYLDTSTHTAYVVIPRTETTSAVNCLLEGYASGSLATSANVSMAAGIGYYTASLSTSSIVYNAGTWTGVDSRTWQDLNGTPSTLTEQSAFLQLDVIEHGAPAYDHGAGGVGLTPAISTRGYTRIEITTSSVGGIAGPWFRASSQTPTYMMPDNVRTGGIALSVGTNVFDIPASDQGKMLYLYFAGYAQYGAGDVLAAKITKIRLI